MKLLVFKDGELINELSLENGGHYTVGRKETCHIVLDKFPGISREHFEVAQDQNGSWCVNVLSDVMFITSDNHAEKEVVLRDQDQFELKPYRFQFLQEASESEEGLFKDDQDQSSHNEDQPNDVHFSDIEVIKNEEASEPEPSEPIGDDEHTAVQNFNGVPYLKIIGKGGKKSEFFRLEGSLWVVGSDSEASIQIKEAAATSNHLEIRKSDKGFFVSDQGSAVGTNLNGQKLKAKKLTRLLSGDILTIGDSSLQFELRDQAFKRKVNNIPLQMYKNPLVFFDQEVAMVSFDQDDDAPGSAEQLSSDPTKSAADKKKLIIRAVAAFAVLLMVVVNLIGGESSDPQPTAIGADPFTQLTPPEKKIVTQTHRLAKQLFLAKNYELALVQLDKLHSIIPSYKDSKEIEEFCINSRELKRQRAMIEKQRREEQQLENAVRSYIAQCNQRYATSDDIDGVKACLSPASELDPSNPGISQLITDVTARQEELKIRQKIAAERSDKVRRGKELFNRAKNLHNQHNYLKAIEAYENHIHSGLPDPQRLVKTSKRNLATIEAKIRSKKNSLVGQAQQMYTGTKLKEAVYLARKAQKVDPYDPKISSFLFKVERELTNQMKSIYLDSVIEEQFGNLEASRVKWEDIVKTDVNDGKYYKKAQRKLRQYGFTY